MKSANNFKINLAGWVPFCLRPEYFVITGYGLMLREQARLCIDPETKGKQNEGEEQRV